MTWIQYWIPFIGIRPMPAEMVKELELDASSEWSGLVASWLGRTFLFITIETYED